MSDNLFGLDGGEDFHFDMGSVAERAFEDGWDKPPMLIEEWTSKPLRSFVRTGSVIDHICEYDVEEYLDDYGDVSDKLAKRAEAPEVIAAFDAALDLLFKGITWCWADQKVATWKVTWDPETDPDRIPDFTFERQ